MLPNLLVIGAQKCGTTSLHAYLDLHPDIFMASGKELDFFLEERGWREGRGWYEAHFPEPAAIRGESSPNYTAWPIFPGVPERAAAVVPDARLIYLVRDPIDRIESHYLQQRAMGGERRPIDYALGDVDDPGNTYVCRTRYATQLERWLEHFPRDRLLVVAQEDLRDRRDRALAAVFAFLGVRADFRDPATGRQEHRSAEKLELGEAGARLRRSPLGAARRLLPARFRAPITRRVRQRLSVPIERQRLGESRRAELVALLRPEMDALRDITGLGLEGWSC